MRFLPDSHVVTCFSKLPAILNCFKFNLYEKEKSIRSIVKIQTFRDDQFKHEGKDISDNQI